MKPMKLLLVAIVAVSVVGCTQQQYDQTGVGTKTTIGALAGAAGGGLLASQLGGGATGIAAGVLLGGLLGGAVGNVLDQNDREYANQTTQQSLEASSTGSTSSWQNPDSGNSGIGDAHAHLPERLGPALPGVHPDHRRGWPGGGSLRHGLPPSGRHLADRPVGCG